jgi:hypothetical protein
LEPKSYRLSERQLTSIYKEEIYPRFLEGLPSASNPCFVIICAQPGAGKSAISKRIRSKFAQAFARAAHIDPDLLREYHARLPEIKQEDPVRMGDHTHEDASIWKGYLLNDARDASNNVVTEISLTSADNTKREIEKYRNAGYSIQLHAVAVHEDISRLGIFNRFEKEAQRPNGTPRFVRMAYHDAAYHALPRNVDDLERNFGLNLVTVNARGGDVVYKRIEQAGEPGAMKAILLERNRSWSAEDRTTHLSDWQKVIEKVKARPSRNLKPGFYLADLHQAVLKATGQPIIKVPTHAIEQDVENVIKRAVNSRTSFNF